MGAPYSEGCNNIIRDNEAALITCAMDFVEAMGWKTDAQMAETCQQGVEREMFPDLTEEEQIVVDTLRQRNDLQLNMLSVQCGIGVGRLTALLFSLEMKGVVKTMAGGLCHLM